MLLGLSTQQLTLDSQTANLVFAGPGSGAPADPTFRSLVSADLPASVVETTDADWTDLTDGGATTLHSHAGAAAHTIRENGTDQTARTGLNFVDADAGAGLITDDAVGDETEVNLSLYVLEAQHASPTYDAGHHAANPQIRSTYAARAAAGTAGRIWLQSDGPFMAFDDGTNWQEYFSTFPLTTPVSGDFAWVNQGSASVDTTYGGIILIDPTATGAQSWRIRKKTAPSTPYHIETLVIPMALIAKANPQVGIGFRESGTSKLIMLKFGQSQMMVTYSTSETAEVSNLFTSTFSTPPYIFFRIGADGTNITFDFSYNGISWVQVLTEAKAAHFTTAPDEVLFAVDNRNATYVTRLHLLSWKETA